MADSNRYSRWYVVLFFIFVILILFICSYNLYETYRIKSQVPQEYQESQDILMVLNIIGIVIALILLIGYYFAGDKTAPVSTHNLLQRQAINLPMAQIPNSSIVGKGFGGPVLKPSPFCRTPIDMDRL